MSDVLFSGSLGFKDEDIQQGYGDLCGPDKTRGDSHRKNMAFDAIAT